MTVWFLIHSVSFPYLPYWQDLLLFSHWVMSNSLWPHGLQHARLPYPSLSLQVCSNWCHDLSNQLILWHSLLLPFFQHQGFFQWVSSSHQVARVQSFSFSMSPFNEYSIGFPLGLIGLNFVLSKGLSKFSNTTIWLG